MVYYVSFSYVCVYGRLVIGSLPIERDKPIRNMDDIKEIAEIIKVIVNAKKGREVMEKTDITITFWKRFEDET